MTNGQKLDELRVWLHDHNIGYNEAYNLDGVECDLWISLYRVAVIADGSKADEVYPKLTENHVRAFFIREGETKNFVVEKMRNCINDIRLKRATRYCWHKFTPNEKQGYKGTWPLNFKHFKNSFGIILAEAENDLDIAVNVFIKNTPKEAWL